MRMDMHLGLRPEMRLGLAPRMIQSMEILQLPIMDLQARIQSELQENPFLELKEKRGEEQRRDEDAEFDPDATLHHDETGDLEFNRLEELNKDWEDHFNEEHRPSRGSLEDEADRKQDAMANMVDRPPSLHDYLNEQLNFLDLPADEDALARHIIAFIDRTGHLGVRDEQDRFRPVSLLEIAESAEPPASLDQVERVLTRVVQKLDPPGVGARSLSECLLLQLTPDTPLREVLSILIRDHLEDVAYNRIPLIQKVTRLEVPTIRQAIELIQHLDPKPGLRYADSGTQYVVPDILVERNDQGDYDVRLKEDWTPNVRISKRYLELYKNKGEDPKAREFLKQKLQSAQWLLSAVEQRRNTLLRVTRAIINHQRAFLDFGPEHIQPLKMQQIADQVGVHVTTVSRAVDDKWVQTPRGIFPLKRFFGGGKENKQTGEEVAYEVMKQRLMELIDSEDKANPLSDEELVARLNESGYPVARRTVTKYRKMLKIPSSRQRKDWSLTQPSG